jgi:hypothetical protein
MDAGIKKEIETNDLAVGAHDLWVKAKSGELVNPRIVGLIVAVCLIFGLWWFLSSSRQKAASAQWRELDQIQNKKQLEEFVKAPANANSSAGKLARLQLARVMFDTEGVRKLNVRGDVRQKGIESIEAARKEFEVLTKEFAGDPTMKAQVLDLAAKAELALAGIPTSATASDSRGSVEKAVGYLKEIAETVGATTTIGKQAAEQAAEFEKKREEILSLGLMLHTSLTPLPPLPSMTQPGDLNPLAPKPGVDIKLPGNVEPAATPPSLPAPTSPPPAEPAKPDAPKPDAAAVGGAAAAATPEKKK